MKLDLYHDDFQKTRNLVKSHDYRGVIEILQSRKPVYMHAPDSQRGAYHYLLGASYSKIGDYKQADHHFDLALSIVPKNHKIKLEMLDSYLQRGSTAEAASLLQELDGDDALKRSNSYSRFYNLIGKYYKLTGDYYTARHNYNISYNLRIKDIGPSRDIPLMDEFIAATQRRTDRTKGALEYATHLFHLDRRETPPLNLSLTFLKNCIKHFQDTDDKVRCLNSMSHLSREFNNMTAALDYNEQGLALNPTHPRLLSARIRILIEADKRDEALTHYNRDKPVITGSTIATLALANTFLANGYDRISHSLMKHLLKRPDLNDAMRQSAEELKALTRSPQIPALFQA